MEFCQLQVPVWSELCRLNEYRLEVFVTLLGDRPPGFFAAGFLLGAAQAAVADRLASEKSGWVPNLQRPCQGRDFANAGDGHQPLDALMNQTVIPQRRQELLLHRSEDLQPAAGEPEQLFD